MIYRIASLIAICVVCLMALLVQVLEWLDRVEKYRWLKRVVEAKALRVILLFVTLGFLLTVMNDVHGILEALNKSPKSPPPPCFNLKDVSVCTTIPAKDAKPTTSSQAPQQKNSGGINTQQQSTGNNSPNISAPNGIAIGGGNVTNPTVNNYGPPHRKLNLDDANRKKLIEELKLVPEKERFVGIEVENGYEEANIYAREIAAVLRDAGFPNCESLGVDFGGTAGVVFEGTIKDSPDPPTTLRTVVDIFRQHGLMVGLGLSPYWPMDKGQFGLYVGRARPGELPKTN